jgi:hypothetical protein
VGRRHVPLRRPAVHHQPSPARDGIQLLALNATCHLPRRALDWLLLRRGRCKYQPRRTGADDQDIGSHTSPLPRADAGWGR